MPDKSEWSTADFETISWHDCHVYGFKLDKREHGTAELEFDLDFIVEFPPEYDFGPWLSRLSQFEQSLARLFGRRVDLIAPSALRNPWFRREADKARVTLYHAP